MQVAGKVCVSDLEFPHSSVWFSSILTTGETQLILVQVLVVIKQVHRLSELYNTTGSYLHETD